MYMYIIMTDLSCCMAETNTTLESNYLPIKKKKMLLNVERTKRKVSANA